VDPRTQLTGGAFTSRCVVGEIWSHLY
jgi:hypothetical protein